MEKSVIIIGNGFDLNLKLKTGYNHFMDSKQFTSLIKNGNYLAKYLQNENNLNKWIDVENELKFYSDKQTYDSSSDKSFEADFIALRTALKEYLKGISYTNIDESKPAYQIINYLIKNENCIVLDFNYTLTVNAILTKLGVNQVEIDKKIIKVHGSIDEDEIVIGVEDNAKIRQDHIFLKKGFYKSYKGINISSILDEADTVMFFGHSLGETDHSYFKSWFTTLSLPTVSKNKKIYISHYGEKGHKEILTQIDILSHNNLSQFKMNNKVQMINTN